MKMWLNFGKVFVQENSLTELGKVLSWIYHSETLNWCIHNVAKRKIVIFFMQIEIKILIVLTTWHHVDLLGLLEVIKCLCRCGFISCNGNSALNGPVYAGIPHRNLFLFLNFIPALINIYYTHLNFSIFFWRCTWFVSNKYSCTSKFPFRALNASINRREPHWTLSCVTNCFYSFRNYDRRIYVPKYLQLGLLTDYC
jgi:hypothetical protein